MLNVKTWSMVTERLQVQTLQVLTLWHSTKFTINNTFPYTFAEIFKSLFHRVVLKNNIPTGQTVECGNINTK